MAKSVELTVLKKGAAEFNLVGKAKINDYTFSTDVESQREDSDWVYSKLNLGVDCGEDGTIYATMQSGFGTQRENIVWVQGKEENEDGKHSNYTIDWEDRFDEEILEGISNNSFIKVGILKDQEDKTVVEKFLTPYDAIAYLKENLTNDTVINIKGKLNWKRWNEKLTYEKEITSIFLSKAEPKDFRARFTQTILIDNNSIGKVDKETRTIPITGYIVEMLRDYDGKNIFRMVDGQKKKGQNLPLIKTFEFKVGEDLDKATQFLKLFKVKSKKELSKITVEGKFSRGDIDTVTVTKDDIKDPDILEMIELGFLKEEDILNQMAKANNQGSSPEKMYILKPRVVFKENNGVKLPKVDKEDKVCSIDDVTLSLVLEHLCITEEAAARKDQEEKKDLSEEKDLLEEALKNLNDDDDDEEEDWLSDLN